MDDGIGNTLVSLDAIFCSRREAASRPASLTAAATVTARHSRFVDRCGMSMTSDSSSQSSAESLASSGPNKSVTAAMNADSSVPAVRISSSQDDLLNDSSLLIQFPLFQIALVDSTGCDARITPETCEADN